MKILLDTCVWGGVVQELRAVGHDVVWAGDWQEDPGDDEILERAHGTAKYRNEWDSNVNEKYYAAKNILAWHISL